MAGMPPPDAAGMPPPSMSDAGGMAGMMPPPSMPESSGGGGKVKTKKGKKAKKPKKAKKGKKGSAGSDPMAGASPIDTGSSGVSAAGSTGTVSAGSGSWQKATATYYTSYPECCHNKSVDQSECEDYSGCKYEGMFAAFPDKKPKEWVESNDIVAFYQSPNDRNRKEWGSKWKNKKINIRNPKNGKVMTVTIVDTCDDGDCSGCCSKNANKNGGTLVDLESNTAKRFYGGKPEGLASIEWQAV